MAIQSQPSRIPEPFAGSGTKNVIPATNATPSASQAASWASGFPPECSQPISAGGCPVPRNDVNGALNQLSQDFAFRQDGGIWEWSALADYDTQRMVRGADGYLYWSVAQSGPGFGAGAVDPTTDDGTYWSAPALKTMALADNSTAGATTEWVKDLAAAPVYVDPAGSDSNDGMTAATPVKTFAKAAEIAALLPQTTARIIAAAGTYDGDVAFSSIKTAVSMSGNVSINGNFAVSSGASALIEDSSYQLAVNGFVSVSGASKLVLGCVLSVVSASPAQNENVALRVADQSFLQADKVLNISSSAATAACVAALGGSALVLGGKVALSGTGNGAGLFLNDCSTAAIRDGIDIAAGAINGNAIYAGLSSSIDIYGGTSTINSAAGTSNIVYLRLCASLRLRGSASVTLISNGSSSVYGFYMTEQASAVVEGNLTFSVANTLAQNFFLTGAFIYIFDTATVDFGTGARSYSVHTLMGGGCNISADATLTGSPTGKRYVAGTNSSIWVHGSGANRIPGSTAGSVSDGGYYG